MDLQDRIANISVRSSVVEDVTDDSMLQIEEIAISSLEMSDPQRPSYRQSSVSFFATAKRRLFQFQLTPWKARKSFPMTCRFGRKARAWECLLCMVRTISKSHDASRHCWRMRKMAGPRAGHRFEGVCEPFLATVKAYCED